MTSAQYPKPAHARKTEAVTDAIRLKMSFAESTVKRRARLRRAECTTDKLVIKIVLDMATATGPTRALW
jgi:hypothetical protein